MTTAYKMDSREYAYMEDMIIDAFANACFDVEPLGKAYNDLTEVQQQEVKGIFFKWLKDSNLNIDTAFTLEFSKHNPGSALNKIFSTYKYNQDIIGFYTAASDINSMKGEKVTIIKLSDFGFPVVIQTRLNEAKIQSYAQYSDSLKIIHTPKRKRNMVYNLFTPADSGALIYKGWINIDANKLTYNTIEEGEQVTTKQSKYGSFDRNYLFDTILEYGQPDIQF
jgi:hypothetical protein